MAVKLRFTRMGRRHRPFFRLNAIESRNPRDGKTIEKLGHYDPLIKDSDKQVVLNKERIEYWLSKGAVPSDTVANLLAKHGIVSKYYEERQAKRKRAKEIAHAKGKPFDATERAQAAKAAEAATKAAEEAEAKAKAEAEAKAKAEAEASSAEDAAAGTEEKASE